MLFFAIELDDEQINKDGIINLDAAYQTIEDTFAQRNVKLCHKEGNIRFYTRNIDKHDFEYLWMVNKVMKTEKWFMDNIKVWRYIDEEDGFIFEEEDLLEED